MSIALSKKPMVLLDGSFAFHLEGPAERLSLRIGCSFSFKVPPPKRDDDEQSVQLP